MIEVRGLTKRYGDKVAVNDLSFGIEPGKVTGFLGPNGAGKTTTMRLILGLDGLDPEGILWIRNFMKTLAAQGRTVFVSSHLMSEMENTADHLIVVGRGELIADCTMAEFIARSSGAAVKVRTPAPDSLVLAVAAKGGQASADADGTLLVRGLTTDQVGDIAFEQGIRVHELTAQRASLEEAFMELTGDSVEYRAGVPEAAAGAGSGVVGSATVRSGV